MAISELGRKKIGSMNGLANSLHFPQCFQDKPLVNSVEIGVVDCFDFFSLFLMKQESGRNGTEWTLFMPDMHTLLRPPYFELIFGVISFSAAVVWTYTGKVWARFHGWVYRAEEPTDFWWAVAMYYLIGIFLIGYFLYKVHAPSN